MWLSETKIFYDKNGKQSMSIGENNDFCFGSTSDTVIEAPTVILNNCRVQAKKIGAFTSINEDVQLRYIESIGRFCSIAQKCEIGLPAHPTHTFSTSDVFYKNTKWSDFWESYEYERNQEGIYNAFKDDLDVKITIGNDVWIGQGVRIAKSVTIGDGAIIGAGAVVTKDVPPYTIVGGVPAKVIKKRFSDEIISKLLELKWWEYGPDILRGIDITDVSMKQLSEIEERIKDGFPKYKGIYYKFSQTEKRIYKLEKEEMFIVYDEKAEIIEHGGISGGSAQLNYETGELKIYGWFLPSYVYDEIQIFDGLELLGRARLKMVRTDVVNNYPKYGDARSGWIFNVKLKNYNNLKLRCKCLKNGKEVYKVENIRCRVVYVENMMKYHITYACAFLHQKNENVATITEDGRWKDKFSKLYNIVNIDSTQKAIVCTENWEEDVDKLQKKGINAIPFWMWMVVNQNMINYDKLKLVAKSMCLGCGYLLSYIKRLFSKELILVYGNCQVRSINSLMTMSDSLMDKYMIIEMLPVQSIHTEEKEQGFSKDFVNVLDVFIYQNVSKDNKFSRMLATEDIIEKLSERCKKVCIPNVYFSGYYPQLCANPYNPYFSEYGNGPFPQGDKNIIELSEKYSVKEIIDIISTTDFYNREECENNVDKSFDELKERERKCDVIISDYIEENYKKEWLMFTPNHPNNIVLLELLKRVFECLGEKVEDIQKEKAFENSAWQMPIYPSVQKNLNLKFKKDKFCYWKVLKEEESDMTGYVTDYIKFCSKNIDKE